MINLGIKKKLSDKFFLKKTKNILGNYCNSQWIVFSILCFHLLLFQFLPYCIASCVHYFKHRFIVYRGSTLQNQTIIIKCKARGSNKKRMQMKKQIEVVKKV